MSTLRAINALIFLCLIFSFHAQANTARIVEQGEGFNQLLVDADSLGTIGKTRSKSQDLNVYTFNTLAGVLNADLPGWLTTEVFNDHGYAHWSDAPSAALQKELPTIVIDIDEMNLITREMANQKTKSLCGGEWSDETKTYHKDLNRTYSASKQQDAFDGAFSSTISGELNTSGHVEIVFDYRVRSNPCFGSQPYRFDYKHTLIDVKANIDRSELNYTGALYLAYEGDILNAKIELLEFEHTFWAHIAKVELISSLNLNVGLEVDASTLVSFEGDLFLEGHANLAYTCYVTSCEETDKSVDFILAQSDSPRFGAEVDITLRPFADLNMNMDVELYWKAIEVAEFQLGVIAALPIRLYAYTGNTCGDANTDGIREWVNGALLDVNFETYMYMRTDVLGKEKFFPINMNLGGLEYYHRSAGEINAPIEAKVYYSNIYFDDLMTAGSSILTPVINAPEIIADQGAGAIIAARPCYPYQADLTLEVNWGDGQIKRYNTHTNGTYLKHDWSYLGDVNLSSRIIEDKAGRKIDGPWTYKTVNISPNGQYPFYPWLPSVISGLIM